MFVKWFLFLIPYVLLWKSTSAVELKKTYHQTDYNVKLEIIEIVNVNSTYGRNCTAGLHWHNRTTRVANGHATIIKYIGKKSKFELQAYKFLSNEYRFFPLSITFTCANTASNTFGIKEFCIKYGNIPTDCDVKKGYYYMKDAVFDYSQLPPYIPSGRYKLELKVINDHDYVGTLNIFAAVEEIKKWWK